MGARVVATPSAGTSLKLDRPTILEAALSLVDREGLAGLNMRALAQELGVGTMSLYHYVPNKDALLDGIAEALLGEIAIPGDRAAPWDVRAASMARSFRDVCLRHPNCVPALVTRPFATPASLAPCEAALSLLAEGGCDPERALIAFRAIVAYILGFVTMETAGFFEAIGGRAPPPEDLAELGLPHLSACVALMPGRDIGADFDAGFRVVLLGSAGR